MTEFVAALEPLNALADRSPGFVWRLQTDAGDATAVRAFDDERMLVNLSVWQSLEALRAFVYRGPHRELLRRRQRWFEAMREACLVLWWVPAGHTPSLDEACSRLALLRAHGPTASAFDFRATFPPPAS